LNKESNFGTVDAAMTGESSFDATVRIGKLEPIRTENGPNRAYVPVELPFDPPLQLGPSLQRLLQTANLNLGRLDGAARVLPNRELLITMYLRKEAALTSQIEGTVATLEDLLLYEEAPRLEEDDLREAVNYSQAMRIAIEALNQGEALDISLIERLHAELLKSGRGSKNDPGQLRTKQNFVSGRRPYVPPPPHYVEPLMRNLTAYIQQVESANALIAAAIAHVQFESIHPFMDGNGRLGRMLITLIIYRAGILRWPLLFPSLYLKENREDYFSLLSDVREHGDWESWIEFFLTGIASTAETAAHGAASISELLLQDRTRVAQKLGGNALLVYEKLLHHPTANAWMLAVLTGFSEPTVRKVLVGFEKLGICSEVTGGQRYRRYRYDAYLNCLNAGTEITTG
jgi:Fic family protein